MAASLTADDARLTRVPMWPRRPTQVNGSPGRIQRRQHTRGAGEGRPHADPSPPDASHAHGGGSTGRAANDVDYGAGGARGGETRNENSATERSSSGISASTRVKSG